MRYTDASGNGNGNGIRVGNAGASGTGDSVRGVLGYARRGSAAVAVAACAALALTGCQPTDSPSPAASSAPSGGATGAAGSPTGGSTAPESPSAGNPSSGSSSAGGASAGGFTPGAPSSAGTPAGGGSASDAASPPAAGGSGGGAVKTCPAESLEVSARQAADRPVGTGTGAAIVEFTNVSDRACVLKGHPSVAGAGNGSPGHNRPLAVTPAGPASPVTVAPGGRARVKLTFVQVQGEADGYCRSGAEPSVYPTIVVGLPGSGAHQVALDDGQFAECDDTVTVTAVAAAGK